MNLDDLNTGLHSGREEKAIIKAIIPVIGSKKLPVRFWETAFILVWQIVEKFLRLPFLPKLISVDSAKAPT